MDLVFVPVWIALAWSGDSCFCMCVFMISWFVWLATSTFFFLFFFLVSICSVWVWNCTLESWGESHFGLWTTSVRIWHSPLRNRQLHYNHSYALYFFANLVSFFLRLSIGGWGFFFFQVHISFPSFGDCSYYDYGMLIVSICLINLLFSLRTKFPRIFLFHLLFISVPFLSWVYLGRKERKIGWGSK